MTRVSPEAINDRAIAIGHQMFDLADRSQPHFWQKSWWLEQMTNLVERDEQFKGRAYEFVDCLPALKTPSAITKHLREYLSPDHVKLPRMVHAAMGKGPLGGLREELIGRSSLIGARQMAGRFITGFDIPSAIRTIKWHRKQNMAFTIDVLGEFISSYKQAERYAQTYHELIDALAPEAKTWPHIPIIDEDASGPMPKLNLSIKLSSLDPHFDAIDPEGAITRVCHHLRPLLRRARDEGAFFNVDMEAVRHRDITFDLFKRLLMEDEFRDWADVGIVVQAYLTDCEKDMADLLEWGRQRGARFAIRLVKGAYWDAETAAAVRSYKTPPVWQKKWQSDAAYERLTRMMLENTDLIRPAFASHNVRSLSFVMATAESLGLSTKHYELQTLYGMGDPLKTAMVKMGQCVRVYSPYGDLMPGMGYLIRRLLENSSNDGFLKQSFSDRASHAKLLADPAVAQPPSSPLPQRFYQDPDPESPMLAFKNASNTNFAHAANREKMIAAIQQVRGQLGREYPLVIGGASKTTGAWYESHNPSQTTEIVGRIAQAEADDVDRAVASARKAFEVWRHTSAKERAGLLKKVADRIEDRRFELAATMCLEVGKTWREADADVTEAVDHCRYYAEQMELIESRPRLRNLPGEDNMLTYSPKGVCAAISPWPFPLALLTGMATAAMAAGNTVVIKPANQAAVTAAKFMGICTDVGIPQGVINYLPGSGETVGKALVAHGEVSIVAFTGSREVGTEVIRAGAEVKPNQRFIKKVIVEAGGKNCIIVDDDAELDGAVHAIIESAFSFAGQKCSSCSRLIVLDNVYDESVPETPRRNRKRAHRSGRAAIRDGGPRH